MTRALLVLVTFVAVFASLLCGALGIVSLAAGRLPVTLALLAACAVTAWLAFHLPQQGGRR